MLFIGLNEKRNYDPCQRTPKFNVRYGLTRISLLAHKRRFLRIIYPPVSPVFEVALTGYPSRKSAKGDPVITLEGTLAFFVNDHQNQCPSRKVGAAFIKVCQRSIREAHVQIILIDGPELGNTDQNLGSTNPQCLY